MKRLFKILLLSLTLISILSSLISCALLDKIPNCTGEETIGEAYDKYNCYDYAVISFPNGNIEKVELEYWYTVTEGVIYVKGTNGYFYVTDISNCTLINDPNVAIDVSSFRLDLEINTYDRAIFRTQEGNVIDSGDAFIFAKNTRSFHISSSDGFGYLVDARDCVILSDPE